MFKDTSRLIELLIAHYEEEEQPDGLFDELRAALPHEVHHLEGLRQEHRQFLNDLYGIQGMLRGDQATDMKVFSTAVTGFVKRLRRHESRENELLFEAAGGRPLGTVD